MARPLPGLPRALWSTRHDWPHDLVGDSINDAIHRARINAAA
jgi:hypothetical protein